MKTNPALTLVQEEVRRNPEMPARTMARMLLKKHPKLFTSLAACESRIRRTMGISGNFPTKVITREKRRPGLITGLPNPLRDIVWRATPIAGPCRALILNDVHIPFHDVAALSAALREGQRADCNVIVLNGDFFDCYTLSRWQTDPRLRGFKREIDMTRRVLTRIRELFPTAKIVWKLGNHEERYVAAMTVRAPELLELDRFSFASVMGIEDFGIEMVQDMRPVRLGKLNLLHGHEYRFAIQNPVNPARGLFLRGQVNGACGHFHQVSQHSAKNMEDKVVSCWSIGCLCDLHPRYMPLNAWSHGCAIVEVQRSGAFTVRNLRILDGKVFA